MIAALVIALAVVSTLAAGASVDDRRWRAHLAGTRGVLALQLLALPALAWALDRGLGLGPAGAGLIVAAAAPGGSTGPLLALLAGGAMPFAAALFVALTVAGAVVAVVATLALDVAGVGAVARAAAIVTVVSLAPLLVGLALRARHPTLAIRLARGLSRLGAGLLLATLVALAVQHGGDLADPRTLAVAAALIVASIAPASLLAPRARALAAAQVGLTRNLTLALVVLVAIDAPAAAIGAVLSYGLLMYAAGAAVAVLARLTAARVVATEPPW